jgi:uncharacterized protein YbjT (DUF2867 family)
MYVITGATGNIGKALSFALLENGKKIRVIGRDAAKLKELTDKGAEPAVGDVKDAAFVTRAFAGCHAAFLMIPPSFHSNDFRLEQQKIAKNYADAVRDNNVKFAVLLSSIGAHLRNGAGVVDGLGDMEEYFSGLEGVNVLIMRPTYFMENVFGQIRTIKQMGFMGSPVNGDISFPVVAIRDIAGVAARRMLSLDFKGTEIAYVLGPRDVTYHEIASVIGAAIGKPELKYVQFPYADAKAAMVASGFVSENMAGLYNGLAESMNTGKALGDHKRTPENTTPTTIEEFAQVFALAFKQ